MSLNSDTEVIFQMGCDEAELDEQWSFVQKKSNQRWLWVAIDHATGVVLAYVFGKKKDNVFKQLKAMLYPIKIKMQFFIRTNCFKIDSYDIFL